MTNKRILNVALLLTSFTGCALPSPNIIPDRGVVQEIRETITDICGYQVMYAVQHYAQGPPDKTYTLLNFPVLGERLLLVDEYGDEQINHIFVGPQEDITIYNGQTPVRILNGFQASLIKERDTPIRLDEKYYRLLDALRTSHDTGECGEFQHSLDTLLRH